MAAGQVINWVVNLQGNLTQRSQQARQSMMSLAKTAGDAAQKLNQNQLLAQFEQTSALLIQMGGSISQVGIIASTAARPLALLGTVFGPVGVGAGVAAGAALLFSAGMIKATVAAKGWLDEVVKTRNELLDQGLVLRGATMAFDDYEKASKRLDVASDQLSVTLGNKLAPAMTEIVNATTGIVRLMDDLAGKVPSVTSKVGEFVKAMANAAIVSGGAPGALLGTAVLTGMAGAGALADYGATPDGVQFKEFGPTPEALEDADRKRKMREEEKKEREQNAAKANALLMKEIEAALAADQVWLKNYDQKIDAELELADAKREAARADQDAANERIHLELELQKRREEAAKALEAQQRAQALAKREQTIGVFNTAASGGGVSGIAGAMGAGGPYMALISALANKETPGMLMNLKDEVMDIYTNIPEVIGDIAGEVLPEVIKALPAISAQFAELFVMLPVQLAAAAPAIFASVVEALLSLPQTFADALLELPEKIVEAFTDGIGNISLFGAKKGPLSKIPFFDTGSDGPLARGGLAVLHPGEEVLTAAQSRSMRGGRGNILNFHITASNARDLFRQIREAQGTYGLNETLDPYGV